MFSELSLHCVACTLLNEDCKGENTSNHALTMHTYPHTYLSFKLVQCIDVAYEITCTGRIAMRNTHTNTEATFLT